MEEFLRRLRERKLVQWVLAYAAGAWALLEVADLVGGQFHWPERVLQSLTVAALVGLFIAAVVAWFHGERGQQRVTGTEILLLAVILAAGGLFLHRLGGASGAGEEARVLVASLDDGRPTVAVLPFENLSPDPDDAYFADGVHEDVLTELSRISGLAVIARSSVLRYRNSGMRPREVGLDLNADALLEGSVRREGERVRIAVSLVDAKSETSLWASSYERELTDVFAIQEEVARRVADAMQARLLAQDEDRITGVPTRSLTAYDLALRAREAYYRFTPADNREAIRLLRDAVTADPAYALAWSGLADAFGQEVLKYGAGFARADSAMAAARHALELDPDLPEGFKALGLALQARFDQEGAEAAYRRALELQPNLPDAANNLGTTYSVRGRFDEALLWYLRALRLDPVAPFTRGNVAETYGNLGLVDEADAWYRAALALEAPGSREYVRLSADRMHMHGDVAGAYRTVRRFLDRDPSGAGLELYAASLAAEAGLFADVLAIIERATVPQDHPMRLWLLGLARMRTGDEEAGHRILTALEARAGREVAAGLRDPRAYFTWAQTLAALGRTDEAVERLRQAHDLGFRWLSFRTQPGLESLDDRADYLRFWTAVEADVARQRARVLERAAGRATDR